EILHDRRVGVDCELPWRRRGCSRTPVKSCERRLIQTDQVPTVSLEGLIDGVVGEVATATPPRVLYHYTSWSGLRGILKTQRMWATAHNCTSDPAELVSANEVIRAAAKERRRHTAPVAELALNVFIDQYQAMQVSRYVPTYLSGSSTCV